MKQYAHHDPELDKGKAIPHPRRENQDTPRRTYLFGYIKAPEYAFESRGSRLHRTGMTAIRALPRAVTIKRSQRGESAACKVSRRANRR